MYRFLERRRDTVSVATSPDLPGREAFTATIASNTAYFGVRNRTGGGRRPDPREPPDAWHIDRVDERDLESVDSRLTALGASKTRIDLLAIERWWTPEHLRRTETQRRMRGAWGRSASEVESRLRSGRPARG
jgi:hypothetical protein